MAGVSASSPNPAGLMETPTIRFNLRELGRKYTGHKRNFDIGGCVRYVNSPECQERMKNRELIGYYGHISRQAFDKLAPHEGGVVNGKWCVPEPAVVTTHLHASPDGTIEHKAQFLDTDAGKLAAKLYQSRVGGFSGVWKDRFGTAFMGFDYVLEPNYSTNRGYIMDSLNPDSLAVELENETIRGALAVFDSLTAERDRALEAIRHLEEENTELMSRCLKQQGGPHQSESGVTFPAVFDSVRGDRLIQDAAQFQQERLRFPVEPEQGGTDAWRDDPMIRRMIDRCGR